MNGSLKNSCSRLNMSMLQITSKGWERPVTLRSANFLDFLFTTQRENNSAVEVDLVRIGPTRTGKNDCK